MRHEARIRGYAGMQDDTKKKRKSSENTKTDAKKKTTSQGKNADRTTRSSQATKAESSTRSSGTRASTKTRTSKEKTPKATPKEKSSKTRENTSETQTRATPKSSQTVKTAHGRLKPSDTAPRSHGYLVAAVLIILGAIIFLMIFTFSASDLTAEAETTLNLFGIVGAWIANIILTLFGLAGFIFPAFCILKGITTFCGRPLDVKPSELIGLTLLLTTVSPILDHYMKGTRVLDHLPGGVLGEWASTLALHYLSVPMFTVASTGIGLLALLMTTDTSLKRFAFGIWKIIAATFVMLGKLLAAPFIALHALITRPRPQKLTPPEDDNAVYDPYDDLSTNDLLGNDETETEDVSVETPPASATPETQEEMHTPIETAPESAPQPASAPPEPVLPEPCSAKDIADKLEEDDISLEEQALDEPEADEDAHPECDPDNLRTEEGLAAILAKVLPGKTRPRSARRSHSVPAIEPEFDFNSIVKPEDIQPQDDTPPTADNAPTAGILGNWKPRTIGKTLREMPANDENESPQNRSGNVLSPVLTGEQKSFSPEVVMDTIALPETQFRPRNITNDILAQCDESLPSQAAMGIHVPATQDAQKTALPTAQIPSTDEKPERHISEQKTGCAASGELAALVRNMTDRPHPRDIQEKGQVTAVASQLDDIEAFFRTGNGSTDDLVKAASSDSASRIRLSGVLDDITIPPATRPRATARDIVPSADHTVKKETTSANPASDDATPKSVASAHDAATRVPTPMAKPTAEIPITPSLRPADDDGSNHPKSIEHAQNDAATRVPTPTAERDNQANTTRLALDALETLKRNTPTPSVTAPQKTDDAATRISQAKSLENKTVVPQASVFVPAQPAPANARSGFDVAEARKRASEEDINEAERVRQESQDKKRPYQRPPLSILNYNPTTQKGYTQEELEDISVRIREKFAEFRLTGEITHVCPGPVVTRFEFKPDPGIKVSRFQDLAQDLMMALEIVSVRILAPIPGKGVVGIEIPNEHRNTIFLKEVLASDAFLHNKSVLTMALGQDTEGTPFVTNLAKMPHILVAGTTGSGKSVGINTMLCSLLYNATPDDVRLILVDPKCLELSIYKDIPHLLTPPITTPAETSAALDWACEEMERRYRLLQDLGVRNIENYNDLIQKTQEHPEDADPRILEKLDQHNDDDTLKHTRLSYIVIVIDEFADLMMVARKEIETQVARLAQKARAAGINMILATQRPSTNVITGVIKANFPARLAFKVQAVVDSQTILGHKGAEALLGRGDSIFQDPSTGLETRVHGCFVSDEEVQAVVDYLHTQGKPEYNSAITASKQDDGTSCGADDDTPSKDDIRDDPAYIRAIELIRQTRKASTSYLQRELGIGYPKAGRIIAQLEKDGMIGPADSKHNREVFI